MVELAQEAAAFGLTLNREQLEHFATYERLLLEWNTRLNLTAIREPAEIRHRHFLDSLTCATVTGDLSGRRLIDVGTGAGFPGVPLKILFPTLTLTLVESVAKKAHFLEKLVATLELTEVTVLSQRAEEVGQDVAHREDYDWAVARSVAELRVLAEYLLPFCRIGGRALAMKGESAPAEIEAATTAVHTLGGGEPQWQPVQLPGRDMLHYLVVIPKEQETPGKYPRRPGMPAKRPL
jgi:16S rRNA (guanine527-N7)-methyltransferase